MTKIGILYDFDKTLCTTDMQEYGFIKNLNMDADDFWNEAAKITNVHQVERILSYMFVMIRECKKRGIPLTAEYLNECGRNVVLFDGVETWFERINEFGAQLGVEIEHYIISSGVYEIIEGTPIAKYFKRIYACRYMYDENGEAIWPALAINYTLKTQYIYRISKGILDVTDDYNLNRLQDKNLRHISYKNMIYLGDGMTDIPCMKMLKDRGGKSIALYSAGKSETAKTLVEDDRTNYVCVADYSPNSTLEKIVKLMIENMVILEKLTTTEEEQLSQFKRGFEQ
ncbi:MAG: haloacid dehalogenase-like hydrolase [Clostridia bacterium]|nr:haloacid dehalogenase-like hydrolase [Clostridia bacterium]MBO7249972.1 haloacid dehalogenase-like hydrolase [Clostridia bacterium]